MSLIADIDAELEFCGTARDMALQYQSHFGSNIIFDSENKNKSGSVGFQIGRLFSSLKHIFFCTNFPFSLYTKLSLCLFFSSL